MVEILRNKNLATKLQILAEIANSGPHIQQKDIAERLEVTPQAISDYVSQLVKDGWLTLDGHSKYKVTNEGVNWIIKTLKDLKDYSDFIVEAITNISVSTAIAESPLVKGQKVGLKMKDGLLFATREIDSEARGVAFSDGEAGDDVGIKEIEGMVELETGKVTILKIPNSQRGGSKRVDLKLLKSLIAKKQFTGSIGIEALIALRKVKAVNLYFFGVKEAVVEAAQHGVDPIVACVEDEISSLVNKLEEKNIIYDLVDIKE
jgi:putative transcriptional regulator